MKPITRIDYYLATITNDEDAVTPLPEPITRIDFYLAKLAGENIAELPEPVTRIDLYLAALCGMDVVIPEEPVTRIDFYLAALNNEAVDTPEPVTRIDYYLNNWAEGGGGLPWQTFSGNPLQFSAPKAHTLRSAVVEFEPKQSGTGDPSPDNVRPISGWNSIDVYDDPAYGGTIRWNQLADLVSTTGTHKLEGWASTVAYNADGSVTITTTRDFTEVGVGFSTGVTYVLGHKYYVGILLKSSDVTPTKVNFSFTSAWATACSLLQNIFSGYGWYTGITECVTAGDSTQTQRLNIRIVGSFTEGESFTIGDAIFCDLTAMFGAGNEPATVEEFRELFPHDYYAYNAGEETTVSAVNGNPYWKVAVTWTDEAGTVYGGYLLFNEDGSVDLVGTHGYYDGRQAVSSDFTKYDAQNGYYLKAAVSGMASGSWYDDPSALCNVFPKISSWNQGQGVRFGNSSGNIFFTQVQDDYPTSDGFAAFCVSVGLQLTYPLATPVTYHLPSLAEAIRCFKSINTMWTDGDSLTVEARAEAVNLNALQSLNMLLGGRYVNNHTPEDLTDEEALDIILNGGNR